MNTSLRESASIRLYEMYTRRKIWEKVIHLNMAQWRSQAEIEEIQITKLKKLLCHSYNNVRFYQKKFDATGFNPNNFECLSQLEEIPLITKVDLRDNLQSMMSRINPNPGGFFDSTGGSTGEPTRYYVSGESAGYRAARDIIFRKWYNFNIGDKKAILWGARRDLHLSNRIISYLKQFVYNTIELNAWLMTDNLMDTFIARISKFKPNIIESYAKALLLLTNYAEDSGEMDSLHIPAIISAETITPQERKDIESVVNGVWNRYGSREFGAIAQECSFHVGMHIASENLVLESLVDSHPPNSLLITDLDNFEMPLIRYEIGDCGKIKSGHCKCGRSTPRIEDVYGRIDDFIRTIDGRFIDGTMFGMHLRFFEGVRKYQVIQDAIDRISVYLELDQKLSNSDETALLKALMRFLGPEMKVSLEKVSKLDTPDSGKFRTVISKI